MIQEKIPPQRVCIPNKNTFDYYEKDRIFQTREEFFESISEEFYQKQYLFFFKYLHNALSYCNNSQNRNYILVADINEKVLELYIGCGRYIGNQIEYRVPRCYITPDTIKEFLYYEPCMFEQKREFLEKYPEEYYSELEDKEATQIMSQKKLVFNEYKKKPIFESLAV